MTLTRRDFLNACGLAALAAALPGGLLAAYAPRPDGWKTFSLTTRVDLPADGKAAQAWVPVPYFTADEWTRPGETTFATNGDAELVVDDVQGVAFVHARWEAGQTPELQVVSTVETQSRHVPLTETGATMSDAERAELTAPTDLIPTDGIVAETAAMITDGAVNDLDRAQRIYDWVVTETERNPDTRGCGLGDVASMLHTGDLTGKCADLNALYVGLARASGLPARDLYGLRVAPSSFGYKALGAGSEVVTGAQHCRAEVFVEGIGWLPVDPADVRKVVLAGADEGLTLDTPKVVDVRKGLFGAAEGNWVCLNDAHDVVLPGSTRGALPFLMYPQAEIDGRAQDELDPSSFTYTITAQTV
ncbi:transglutaminase-like putative cysteine protease [Sagittula marina]|uniref:Transglutaminase-like putative cysteine protease n=1 Tax=Sagittula marina TaxID=943940 RepID=A0A7W6DKG3_9RHOB|nr:transglutaminase domain-containing protein [Sagittula marina]MBB3984397.1 transglutaminase-like putative cysteine protease [Sagittula marina]